MTRILSFQDITNLDISLGELINSVEEALIAHSNDDVFLLPKITLRPSDDTFYTAMGNPAYFLRSHSLVIVFDFRHYPAIFLSGFLFCL